MTRGPASAGLLGPAQLGQLLRVMVEASQASPEEAVKCMVALAGSVGARTPCGDEGVMQCYCAVGQVLRRHSCSLGRYAAVLQSYVQAKESMSSPEMLEAFEGDEDMFSLAAAIFLDSVQGAPVADAAAVCQVLRIFVAKQTNEVIYRLLQEEVRAKVGDDVRLPDWARDSPFSGERISAFGDAPSAETTRSDMEYMLNRLSGWEHEPAGPKIQAHC